MKLNELKTALANGPVRVTFTKKDGSNRTGYFTTKEELLAPVSGTGTRTHPNDLLVVTEILANEEPQWRSFHYDQITEAVVGKNA